MIDNLHCTIRWGSVEGSVGAESRFATADLPRAERRTHTRRKGTGLSAPIDRTLSFQPPWRKDKLRSACTNDPPGRPCIRDAAWPIARHFYNVRLISLRAIRAVYLCARAL